MDRLRAGLTTDDLTQQALRTAGGLLLGIGMLVVAIRRSAPFANPWDEGLIFLVLLAPCVFLYGVGMLGARASEVTRGWQSAYLIFGTLLVPFALFGFLNWIGGTPDAGLNIAWIFLATAGAAIAAALVARVRYGLLLAGLALTVSWLGLWDAVLSDGLEDEDVRRGLLLGAGALLVVAGITLRRRFPEREPAWWNELITAGGVAAIAGSALQLGLYYLQSLLSSAFSDTNEGFLQATGSWAWDAALLAVSLALIGWAWYSQSRGPAYVGAVGLALFVLSVGYDVDDSSPSGHIVGWPLIVLVIGAGAVVASFVLGSRIGPSRPVAGETPPPAPGHN